jgi:hypothetical protein
MISMALAADQALHKTTTSPHRHMQTFEHLFSIIKDSFDRYDHTQKVLRLSRKVFGPRTPFKSVPI